jgi:hypothetical protein
MPAFQSVPDLGLSRKYHLKSIGCEIYAEHASDLTTEQQWHELAVQWHSMADQAAKMSGETALDEFKQGHFGQLNSVTQSATIPATSSPRRRTP